MLLLPMKSGLVISNSLHAHGLPALTTRERVDDRARATTVTFAQYAT